MTRLFSIIEGPPQAPVVMLHTSLACTHRMWDRQLEPLLASGWRVLRYDLRGHGASPELRGPCTLGDLGQDAVSVLADHGIAHAAHVGLSLGAMIAMWLAEQRPALVDSLVLCSTSAHLEPGPWRERADLVLSEGTQVVADQMARRWLTTEHAAKHPEDLAWIRSEICSTSSAGYAAGCNAIATMDIEAELGQVRVPTLVVAGAQDPGTPPDHGQRIAEAVPKAHLHVLDPGAHLLSLERPQELAALIVGHLDAPASPVPDRASPPTSKEGS